MSWEALTALGTLLSAVVIAVTVLFAARQVRVTSQQLEHLRRATQLDGVLQIIHELRSDLLDESQLFINSELATRMRDEEFRRGVARGGRADLSIHKELHLLRFFETLGALVKYGLIDADIIYDLILPRILSIWTSAAEVIAIQKKSFGSSMWENYTWLVNDATRWAKERGTDFRSPGE